MRVIICMILLIELNFSVTGQIVNVSRDIEKPLYYDEEIIVFRYTPRTDEMRRLLDTLMEIKWLLNVMGFEEGNSMLMFNFLARERCRMDDRKWGVMVEILPNGDLGETTPGSIHGVIEYKGQILLIAYLDLPWYRKNYEEFRKHFDVEEGRATMKIQRVKYDWVWTYYLKLKRHFFKKRWAGDYQREDLVLKLDSMKKKRQHEKLIYDVNVKKIKNYYLYIRKIESWATYVKEICFYGKTYEIKPLLYDVGRYGHMKKYIMVDWLHDSFRIDVCHVDDFCWKYE